MVPTTNKIIVAGCQYAGLAAIRSLGRHGLHVIGISYHEGQFGLYSRYISQKVICPHPRDARAFADFLLERADEWEGALILESNDYYATAISQHKAELSKYYRLVTPDWEHAQLFIEKDRTYQLADECGVPHPGLHQINSLEELSRIEKDLVFPVMIKPVRSHEFTAVYNKKLFIIENASDLRRKFQDTVDHHLSVVIQEIIPGTDEGTLESIEIYVDSTGTIGGKMFNVKLRQSPPMFGIMSAGKSVPPIADIEEHALRMLRHLNYHGFASFEFKRDYRDGLPKLIEVNIRQVRNLQLLLRNGFDVPWLIYQDIVLGAPQVQTEYRATYFLDLFSDVSGVFNGDSRRVLKVRKFVGPYFTRNKALAVFDPGDLRPFFKMVGNKIGQVAGRLPRVKIVPDDT